MNKLLKKLIIITIISFIFHSIWEYWACTIFYGMDTTVLTSPLMWSAIFGDIMTTIILYLLLSLTNKSFNWIINKWQLKEYIIIILYSLFLSFYFEISALYTGRWSYSNNMPLLPSTNIGIIPVIQFLILLPLTLYITKLIALKLLSNAE
ncbi:hypothetical protein SH2C18_13720 [Clostridium sediminicola]|uniref:hypothetical protein n=1 Tax=Clostridium sediminicola TaxID=3114879 RepID=UPI0031F25599